MKITEVGRKLWRSVEAAASALDYDPRENLTARVERLERLVAELGNRSRPSV